MAQTLGSQLRNLKASTFQQLTVQWLDMEFHNKGNVSQWLSSALPIVQDSYDIAVEFTSTMNDIQIGLLLDNPEYGGIPISPDDMKKRLRNGVASSEVYARPFVDFWLSLKNGGSIDDALHSGAARIGELLDTDIERLSDFTSVEKFANENSLVGYRRVLTGATNCALCVVASTQRYRRGNLKPIHPHCNCKVSPVLNWEDDGASQILDEDLLNQLHSDIASRFGEDVANRSAKDYNKIMVTRQHGEIGPYLGWRGQHFAGPSSIN